MVSKLTTHPFYETIFRIGIIIKDFYIFLIFKSNSYIYFFEITTYIKSIGIKIYKFYISRLVFPEELPTHNFYRLVKKFQSSSLLLGRSWEFIALAALSPELMAPLIELPPHQSPQHTRGWEVSAAKKLSCKGVLGKA